VRKRVIGPVGPTGKAKDTRSENWLSLTELADVEVTSESSAHPVEGALLEGQAAGWRAGTPGQQTIRLLFKQPTPLRRIALRFVERDVERTQEYVLRWSADGGRSFRDVVRQQWNFSPHGSTEEAAHYEVNLPAVTVIELTIVPDKSGGAAVASLQELRFA
jgi:hypothetical protein